MTDYRALHGDLVFIDGPLTVFVKEASEQEILDAAERIQRYLVVAAKQLGIRSDAAFEKLVRPLRPSAFSPDDRGGSPDGA
jgi:hypothetical protein